MDHFSYKNGTLHAEGVDLVALAKEHGTPAYVYSRATLERHYRAFDDAFEGYPHKVCYAVKANSNIAVLNVLARLGAGFDIVSVGELERVLKAGGKPEDIVFSGVGKREDEIARALEAGIHCFNIESDSELNRVNEVAGSLEKIAPISIRVNPDVDAKTHPYISTGLKENKFGINIDAALATYKHAATMQHVAIKGIDCHIGSQLTQIDPYVDALERVLALVAQLEFEGIMLEHIDMGGGLGIVYDDESAVLPMEQIHALLEKMQGRTESLIIEPGRAIAGNAGVLLTQVEHIKHNGDKAFAIVDAAMNDLMRPALYQAYQEIVPLKLMGEPDSKLGEYDVVGPVCESGDFLAKDRYLSMVEGEYFAVRSAGAYGFTMSSNYNSRPRAVELMVDEDKTYVVRARETIDQLMQGEQLLPETR